MSERRFVQQSEPLLRVRRRKIWMYLLCQIVGVILPVAISQTIAAIGESLVGSLRTLLSRSEFVDKVLHHAGFPVLVCILIPFRWKIMPRWFTVKELEIMDDLTANSKVVLASLGGAPKLPKSAKVDDYVLERRFSEAKAGETRQRAGSQSR